jgi:hypothetical protein
VRAEELKTDSGWNGRRRCRRIAAGVSVALSILSVAGVASAAWSNKSTSGNAAAGSISLGTPGSFGATCDSSSSRQVDFTWSTVANASGYKILDSTTGQNGTYAPLQTVTGGGTTSANTGNNLNASTYYFEIEATVGSNWVGIASGASGPRTITHVSGNSYTCS